jgi:hypothetical protein
MQLLIVAGPQLTPRYGSTQLPPVYAGGLLSSFLTAPAQTNLLAGVSRLKAVIGPVTDGGFL